MNHRFDAIVLGASTGGLAALQTILSGLHARFSIPVIIVQHRIASAQDHLVELLASITTLAIKEAEEKEDLKPGYVYIAPANYHLLVEANKTFSLTVDPRVTFARPSIDVLFESAADTYKNALTGVLLTGANHDGTNGLLYIKNRGGITIAQNPESAEAPTMPASAIHAGAVDYVLEVSKIAEKLLHLNNGGFVE